MTLRNTRNSLIAAVLLGGAMLTAIPASAQSVSVGTSVTASASVNANASTDLLSQLLTMLGL